MLSIISDYESGKTCWNDVAEKLSSEPGNDELVSIADNVDTPEAQKAALKRIKKILEERQAQ